MTKAYDYREIDDAVACLERASSASIKAQQYPHSRNFPCESQMGCAAKEIAAALELIKKAEYKT